MASDECRDELLEESWQTIERGPHFNEGVGRWYVIAGGEIVCEVNACGSRDSEGLAKHIVNLHNEELQNRGAS